MLEPRSSARIRCGVCGRKHEPKVCTDTPKGADSWRYVNKLKESMAKR